MKRFLLLSLLAGFAAATPQLCVAQTDDATMTGDVAASEARAEIQKATDALNDALKRGDAAGALQWLAPDFELGRHQYRVRDLAWMKTALPLQLQSARYTKLSTEVTGVGFEGAIARTQEIIDAEAKLKVGARQAGPLRSTGIEGSGSSEWEETARGWRLKRANDTLELLLFTEAPPAPSNSQPAALADGTAAVLGLTLEKPLAVLERRDGQGESAFAFSPDSRELVFNYDAQNVTFASTQSGETVRRFAGLQSVNEMAYANDGSLWTADNEGRVRQIDMAGKVRGEWKVAEQYAAYKFGVAPDGATFAVGGANQVQLWDAASGRMKAEFAPELPRALTLEFSPDGSLLALGSWSDCETHNAADGALLRAFEGERWGEFAPGGELWTMKFVGRTLHRDRANEDVLFARDAIGEIKRQLPIPMPWSAAQQKLSEELDQGKTVHTNGYNQLPAPRLAPDGKRAASIYYDGTIGIWNTQTGNIERILLGFSSAFDPNAPSLAFSPDGTRLAASSHYGEIAIWDVSLPQP